MGHQATGEKLHMVLSVSNSEKLEPSESSMRQSSSIKVTKRTGFLVLTQILKLIWRGCMFRWTLTSDSDKGRGHKCDIGTSIWIKQTPHILSSPASSGLSIPLLKSQGDKPMCMCVVVGRSRCAHVWVYTGAQLGKTYCYGGNVWTLSEDFFLSDLSCLFCLILLQNNITHTTDDHPHIDLSPWHTHKRAQTH